LPASPLKIDPVVGAVSGSEFGSAGILPIPYAYIMMMGGEGLTHATKVAILSANYIARKLANHFPILYTNEHGYVAHECIIDLRDITKETGVSVDDVAKRLIDYGFHAPTMSFPVAGTLMIEPTESESLAEVDRFINAMLNIAAEIEAIRRGEMSLESSPLRMAPHTAHSLMSLDEPSENKILRAYPHGVSVETKYWPPVGRIDGAYGDRNLTCTCLPIEDLAQG
jgi:glycine dehydrogenase